jgi:hypothetical protein
MIGTGYAQCAPRIVMSVQEVYVRLAPLLVASNAARINQINARYVQRGYTSRLIRLII